MPLALIVRLFYHNALSWANDFSPISCSAVSARKMGDKEETCGKYGAIPAGVYSTYLFLFLCCQQIVSDPTFSNRRIKISHAAFSYPQRVQPSPHCGRYCGVQEDVLSGGYPAWQPWRIPASSQPSHHRRPSVPRTAPGKALR